MNLHHLQYKRRIPPAVANVVADRKSADVSIGCEKVLMDFLISVRGLLFRYHASKMSHDMSSVLDHLSSRSVEATEDELIKLISRLCKQLGTSHMHKATAFSHLSRQLILYLEAAIFDVNKQHIDLLRQEKIQLHDESIRVHNILGKALAAKEQEMEKILSEGKEVESQLKNLQRTNELLKNELEKTLRDQAQTHQLAVELRMQGLDFKAEVDRRCAKVLHSISSRLGFIPSGIQDTIHKLKTLKAPGDPAYDSIRSKVTDCDNSIIIHESKRTTPKNVFTKDIAISDPNYPCLDSLGGINA